MILKDREIKKVEPEVKTTGRRSPPLLTTDPWPLTTTPLTPYSRILYK
jgi:hypothetical protein